MEKKTLYLIYVIIVLPFAVACRDTEDNLTVSTLRSDIHDYLYTINNSEATQRLDSIMYNKQIPTRYMNVSRLFIYQIHIYPQYLLITIIQTP